MTIHEAQTHDLPIVAKMYKDMLKEANPLREISNLGSFMSICGVWLKSPFHYVFITKHKEQITGLLICEIDDLDGLATPALLVSAAYVIPSFRGSKAITYIMEMSERLSQELKLNLITFATIESMSLSLKIGGVPRFVQIEKEYLKNG